ncbi:MAG: SLC13 family permease, partial [Slackia sp.]|nr:SLC13 family permease [Slackia sp.]
MAKTLIDKIGAFVRTESVLCIALLCALASCAFVEQGHDFFASVDLRVLALLFCLMAAVGGLQRSGILSRCAHALVVKARTVRSLCLTLVALPFFSSMLVTNDVALLAFVPFAIAALAMANATAHLPRIIVLQAVAANIGGMVTPMGNPQNLFLYTAFDIPTDEFFFALVPFALATFAALVATCLFLRKTPLTERTSLGSTAVKKKQAIVYAMLFCLCLAAVVRIIPYEVAFIAAIATLAVCDRAAFRHIDYGLLATFVCFFVFSGNIAAIPAISSLLSSLMEHAPFLTS